MTDEFAGIFQKQLRKYVPPGSAQLFHYGVIILASLVVSMGYVHFEPMPPELSPEDASMMRLAFGATCGVVIGLIGSTVYSLWIWSQKHRAGEEAEREIFAMASKTLDDKSQKRESDHPRNDPSHQKRCQ